MRGGWGTRRSSKRAPCLWGRGLATWHSPRGLGSFPLRPRTTRVRTPAAAAALAAAAFAAAAVAAAAVVFRLPPPCAACCVASQGLQAARSSAQGGACCPSTGLSRSRCHRDEHLPACFPDVRSPPFLPASAAAGISRGRRRESYGQLAMARWQWLVTAFSPCITRPFPSARAAAVAVAAAADSRVEAPIGHEIYSGPILIIFTKYIYNGKLLRASYLSAFFHKSRKGFILARILRGPCGPQGWAPHRDVGPGLRGPPSLTFCTSFQQISCISSCCVCLI